MCGRVEVKDEDVAWAWTSALLGHPGAAFVRSVDLERTVAGMARDNVRERRLAEARRPTYQKQL